MDQDMILGNQSDAQSVSELKDAIIELYLAIKIRSTEEVSQNFFHYNIGIKTNYHCF